MRSEEEQRAHEGYLDDLDHDELVDMVLRLERELEEAQGQYKGSQMYIEHLRERHKEDIEQLERENRLLKQMIEE